MAARRIADLRAAELRKRLEAAERRNRKKLQAVIAAGFGNYTWSELRELDSPPKVVREYLADNEKYFDLRREVKRREEWGGSLAPLPERYRNPGARKAAPRKRAPARKRAATKKRPTRRRSNTTRGIRARAGELAAYVVRVTLTKPGPVQYVEQFVPPRNAMLVERAAAAHPYTRAQAQTIARELAKVRSVRKAEAVRGGGAPKKKTVANPAARDEALREAAAALEAFSGHGAEHVEHYVLAGSEAAWGLGPVAAIEYIARRDGETAVYRHEFRRAARPLLASSIDGQQLYLLGGAYSVTDRGIVDA